jgi:hypothetical protein
MIAHKADEIHSVIWNHDGLEIRLVTGEVISRPRARIESLHLESSMPPLREPEYANEPIESRITGRPETLTLKMIVDGGADYET